MAEKPVTLTDAAAKALVEQVVAGVTKSREADLLEQFKSFARQELELAEAKREIARRDAEIASLRGHIATLNGFLTAMASGHGAPLAPAPLPNGVHYPAPTAFQPPPMPPVPASMLPAAPPPLVPGSAPEPRPGD